MADWRGAEIRHQTHDGRKITIKITRDRTNALIAEGWVDDIQSPGNPGGVDHGHIWNLNSGDFHYHGLRLARSDLFPGVRDDEKSGDRSALAARDRLHSDLISQARVLASGRVDGRAIASAKSLQAKFNAAGRASPANYQAFRGAMDAIFERAREAAESRKREWAANRTAKEALVRDAESIASSSDLRAAGDRMKALGDRWKAIGPCEKADNDRLWARFNAARTKLRDRRLGEWTANRTLKEALVRDAESIASSSDLRAAGDRMKVLGDRWKAIGPCEKADNDRLWARFNAARTKLRDRKQREFDERKRQWAANKAAKERLVSRMDGLASSSDYRAAKDEARVLLQEWKQVGPCEKADNDHLWSRFKAAQDRLYEAAKRDGDRRRSEARERAQQRVWQLEEQLRNCEASIIRANESYSRALSARSPSMRNPNFYSIVSSQQMRQSQARDRIVQLGQRKDQMLNRLMEARSRLNSF